MSTFRPTTLTVSLSRLAQNYQAVRAYTKNRPAIMAIVKADAYGHGMVPVAKRMIDEGASQLAVATIDEGVALREAGILAPILILGGSCEQGLRAAVHYDIAQSVFDVHSLRILQEEAARCDLVAKAHLKLDTGMSRVGVRTDEELSQMLDAWKDCPRVEMVGAFTHFCVADSDAEYTRLQDRRFMESAARIRAEGFSPILHAAASSGIVLGEEFWHDMVRPGIALYGAEVTAGLPGIGPAQRLTTYPVRIERIHEGDTVSYGRTFTARRGTLIMTVPIGYGDGYPRSLSNKAQALVHGMRVPVVGRICMDQMMLDVTDVPSVSLEDEVVLMGEQGGDRITPDELAVWANTIPWEIMLSFNRRVNRIIED